MATYEVLWLKGTHQVSQAAGVAARALRDNPSTVAVSGDPLVRLEMMHGTFAAMLSGARVAGIRRGKSVLGVAGAVPPGACIDSMLPPGVRTLDVPGPEATDADRFLHLGSILAAHDLLEPHWHVGPVGVEPGFQGMGMGRAAMRLLCDEFDQNRRLAWLETDKPENVRFYSGLGFEVVEEIPLLSARNWFMRREPQRTVPVMTENRGEPRVASDNFEDDVRLVVERLTPGTVLTYGEVALEAGHAGAARAVGSYLSRGGSGLPWWRVVTSTGRLVPGREQENARLLRSEGVPVANGRVAMRGRSVVKAE